MVRFIAILAAGAALIAATPAAALVRVFASAAGTDSASCGSVASPCRTAQYVHDKILSPGGEAVLIGNGDFGPVKIAKAMSIVHEGPGVASLTQPAAAAAVVEVAGVAGDAISLRGLTLDGAWSAGSGVSLTSGASLQMSDCVVRRIKSYAISVGGLNGKVQVTDVTISDAGVGVTVSAFGAMVTIRGLQVTNVTTGLQLFGTGMRMPPASEVRLVDSAISGTTRAIVSSSTLPSLAGKLTLENVRATGNGTGIVADGAMVRLSHSIVAGNGTGVSISNGGSINSDKTSGVVDNVKNYAGGTVTAVAPD